MCALRNPSVAQLVPSHVRLPRTQDQPSAVGAAPIAGDAAACDSGVVTVEGVREGEESPATPVPARVAPAAAAAFQFTAEGASLVGNRAFTRMLARYRALQRVGGWSGAGTAVNQSESTQSGYRRVPITGLPMVDKAIVLIPPGLDVSRPVDVIVHFHGQNQGYKGDPPRDLDPSKDRFEAQLEQVGRPQLVAILPQGSTTGADYGEFSQLKPRQYAEKALERVSALDVAAGSGGLRSAPKVAGVVLSGHSGGGFAIKAIFDDPAQRKDIGGVVWFDAVQAESTVQATGQRVTTGQREMAKKLVAERITAELDAAATSSQPAKDSLAAGFQFRLYYDAAGYYAGAAGEVDAFLKGLFGESGAAPAGQSTLASRIGGLDPAAKAALRARYQVIPVAHAASQQQHDAAIAAAQMNTLGHENMIGSGALQDAVRKMPYGTASPASTTGSTAPPTGGASNPPPVSPPPRSTLNDIDPDAITPADEIALATAPAPGRPPARTLAREEDVPAKLTAAAVARGRSGPTPEANKSLLTSDYIRDTLVARDSNAKIKRVFDYHVQLVTSTDEGPQRERRYDNESGILVVELEDEFIHNPAKSAVDLLPPDRAAHFRGLSWGQNDYPGNGGPLGAEAIAMANEMAVVNPQRRPNAGSTAVITEPERDTNLSRLIASLKPVDGQPGHQLFSEAAEKFSDMADIAALDGVELKILSSWRDPAVARANAARAGNAAAVAAFSSHSLGLAVDVQMSGGSQHFSEIQTHPMSNVFAMRSSPVHKWLVFRGSWFGWYPYGNEPWHWEYNPPGFRDRYRAAVIPTKAPTTPPAQATGAAA